MVTDTTGSQRPRLQPDASFSFESKPRRQLNVPISNLLVIPGSIPRHKVDERVGCLDPSNRNKPRSKRGELSGIHQASKEKWPNVEIGNS